MLRVTVTEAAVQAGRFRSRSWLVVKAIDWRDCGESDYFIVRRDRASHFVLQLAATGCRAGGGGVALPPASPVPRRRRVVSNLPEIVTPSYTGILAENDMPRLAANPSSDVQPAP